MKILFGLMVLVVVVLAFRHLMKRVNFKFHDDPPPSIDLENLGANPKPDRSSRLKQKDT